MWRFVAASVQGTAHAAAATPCQDACLVAPIRSPRGTGLLLAVADGAGSAPASHLGAAAAMAHLAEVAEGGLGPATVDEGAMAAWFRGAARAVDQRAALLGCQPRELACTLLVALVLPHRAVLGQVGDGAIVVAGEDGQLFPVHWPVQEASPNETTFITSPDWEQALQLTVLERPVLDAALLSDGLQLLALDYARRAAHRPFFAPFLQALRTAPQDELTAPLGEYLASEAVSRRTDDDRTLVLATRRLPSA